MSKLLTINFLAENNDINLTPKRCTTGAAGYDLKSNETTEIPYKERKLISTGIKVEIPKGYVGLLFPRSSCFMKGLIMNIGVIDSDYRGDIKFAIQNDIPSKAIYIVNKYDRLGQLLIIPIENQLIFEMSQELSKTDRNMGGFGSTGVN